LVDLRAERPYNTYTDNTEHKMRDFINDLAPWIPVLMFGLVLGFVMVVGAAAAVEHIVVTVQQMLG
jgi:hypothetical protein